MWNLINTITGHKLPEVHFAIGIFLLLSLTMGCFLMEQVNPNERYSVYMRNNTPDTLVVSIRSYGGFSTYGILRSSVIPPDTSIHYQNMNFGIYESRYDERDPVRVFFNYNLYSGNRSSKEDTCRVYRLSPETRALLDNYDYLYGAYIPDRKDLIGFWNGPVRDMGDEVNSFFNYSSWEVIYPHPDTSSYDDGLIEFIITEEDLQ